MLRLIIITTLLGLLAGCSATPTASTAAQPLPAQATTAGVVADGKVLPIADATLSFERAGTVAAILVTEGERVEAGQPLAHLDARALELKVEQAQVGLERATARYNQVAAGAAPAAVTVAEAAVSQAEAQAAQAQAGVTASDVAAAQAQLTAARATLANLLDGPKSTELTQAQAALDQTRATLAQQRDALSSAKTNASLALDQAANNLRERQQAYDRIYWDNRELEEQGDDLPDARKDLEATAGRNVENAEAQLAQARVGFEQALLAEREGVAVAETRVRDAQARLDQLVATPDADRVAEAKARVAAAEATLDQLRGPSRATQLEVADAGIAQAQAQLGQVTAPVRDVDLVAAQVEIDAAQVALNQAKLDLELATLTAPFDGTVARVNLTVGELAGPTAPAIVIADLSAWTVETADLTELEVVRLHEGAAVTVRFDAIPDLELQGTVQQIKLIGDNRQGEIVYTVVIQLDQSDPRLYWNMTAIVTLNS